MPIPKPTTNEPKDTFIQRCMADDVMVEEYPDRQQRMGVCVTSYNDREKKDDYKARQEFFAKLLQEAVSIKQGEKGDKGDPLQYKDLSEEQVKEIASHVAEFVEKPDLSKFTTQEELDNAYTILSKTILEKFQDFEDFKKKVKQGNSQLKKELTAEFIERLSNITYDTEEVARGLESLPDELKTDARQLFSRKPFSEYINEIIEVPSATPNFLPGASYFERKGGLLKSKTPLDIDIQDKRLLNVGGITYAGKRVTADYTVVEGDYLIFANTDGGAVTITLPDSPAEWMSVKVVNTGTNNRLLTIEPGGSNDLIGENSGFSLADGESLELVYNTVDGWY